MSTTAKKSKGFFLTVPSIESHLKMGKRRYLSAVCKGLELEVHKTGRPEFRYYYKDRSGPKPVDRRTSLCFYDKKDPNCLKVAHELWAQALELREKGLPIVLIVPPEVASSPVRQQTYRVMLMQAVPDYLSYLDQQVTLRKLSQKTISPWGFIVKRFERAYGGVALDAMSVEFVQSYLDGLVLEAAEKGADGRSSRMNARACLVNFFEWALAKKLVHENVAKQTSRDDYDYDQAGVEVEDFSRYLSALRDMSTLNPARAAVSNYLWLLALTGCRKDELKTATIGDFYLVERKRVIVASKSKDGKNHWTGISSMAAQIVSAQIDLLKKRGLPTQRTALLFPAKAALKKVFLRWHDDGLKAMSDHVIYKHHRAVADAAGIDAFTIHDFRRIFGTLAAGLGISPDLQRRLISHTTGRRDVHAKKYDKHDYLPELRESASRVAVVLDFLSDGPVHQGKREPTYCGADFLNSFGYWYSESGRRYVNDLPHQFDVGALVAHSLIELNRRDQECGYNTGKALADAEIKQQQALPASKVRNLGQALKNSAGKEKVKDAGELPFGTLDGDEHAA